MALIDIDDIYKLMDSKEKKEFIESHLYDIDEDTLIKYIASRCDIDSVIGEFRKSEIKDWLYYNAEEYGYTDENGEV